MHRLVGSLYYFMMHPFERSCFQGLFRIVCNNLTSSRAIVVISIVLVPQMIQWLNQQAELL